jgi:hypothetical protein
VSCRLHSWLKSNSADVVLRVLEATQLCSQLLPPVIVVLEQPATSVSSLDTALTSVKPSSKQSPMLRLMLDVLDNGDVLRTLTRPLRCLEHLLHLLHLLHRPLPFLARPQRPRTHSTRPRVPRASGNLLAMQVFVPLTPPILFALYNSMQMLTGMQTQVPLLI